jgi:hypothetical protein
LLVDISPIDQLSPATFGGSRVKGCIFGILVATSHLFAGVLLIILQVIASHLLPAQISHCLYAAWPGRKSGNIKHPSLEDTRWRQLLFWRVLRRRWMQRGMDNHSHPFGAAVGSLGHDRVYGIVDPGAHFGMARLVHGEVERLTREKSLLRVYTAIVEDGMNGDGEEA